MPKFPHKMARKHHTVSACYLRLFCENADYILWVGQRSPLKYYLNSVEDISTEQDFNTVELETGKSAIIEQKYADLEGMFSSAVENVIKNGRFCSEQDRNIILELIAVFHIRNPRNRKNFIRNKIEVTKEFMKDSISTKEAYEDLADRMKKNGSWPIGLEIPYEKMKEAGAEKNWNFLPPHQNEIIAYELKNQSEVVRALLDREWTILKAPKTSAGFITCDHPVCVQWNKPQNPHFLYPRFILLPETLVIFPLSNQLALIGISEATKEFREISEEDVWAINGLLILNSSRQIYAKNKEFLYYNPRDKNPRKGFDLLKDEEFK